MKRSLIIIIVLCCQSVASADLALTVNGLDTSKPIEVAGNSNIIIGVAGQTNEQKESYAVTCEMGGKLKPFTEPNTLAEVPTLERYLFTFEDDELDWAMVNLTVGDVLDYQLILFNAPDSNTVIFGVDSDAIEIPEPEPEPEPESEPETFLPLYEQTIVPYAQRIEQEKAQSLKFCPTGVGLISVTGNLPAKESKGRELLFDGCQDGMMGGRGVIDVTTDITSNTVWTSDNTYHVLAEISVQALLVIEPNTTVIFAPDKSMSVNSGGTLISVGTPDNPIIYTSDSGTPGYADYYCPMYIEETASANTKIMYSYVEYAYTGLVVLNNELETDIQNNYFYNNVYGIVEQGIKHTSIRNNLVVASYHSGIEVFLADTTGQASSDSFVLIENNTCDFYQNCGIRIHGVPDANNAGWVVLSNNLVSGSYQYGVYLLDPDEWVCASVLNTGYYDNANNKNWEFEEENPAFENVLPYEMGTGILPVCYLRQDCNFIDAGYHFVEQTELIGKTTDVNDEPDANYVDIGFHYPNWDFSNADDGNSLPGDLNGNLMVNFKDFAIFANYWQQEPNEDPFSQKADIDGSGFVDFNDLTIMTDEWLHSISGHPQISVSISVDPCNLSGDIEVRVSGYGYATEQAFVFIDGEFVQEIIGFEDGYGVELETYAFGNEQHSIKVVTIDPNDIITISPPAVVTFNNELSYMTGSDDFDPGCDYHLGAMYSGECDLVVGVLDMDENVVWSDTYSGNINVSIPAETFDSNGFYDIVVEETCSKSWVKKVSKKFKPGEANPNTKGLIVCPDRKVTKAKFENCIKKSIEAFDQKGIEYIVLYRKNAKYANMAFCLTQLPVKHLYFVGHGNYQIGDKLRTAIQLYDSRAVSYKLSDFDPDNIPPFCEDMGKWEKKTKSILAIGVPLGKLKIVFSDSCYSGRLKITGSDNLVVGPSYEGDPTEVITDVSPSDMSYALGIEYSDQIYKGWYDLAYAKRIFTYYNVWSGNFWDSLGSNDTIYEAMSFCIFNTPGVMLEDGPHYNYRFKGFGNIQTIRLQQ